MGAGAEADNSSGVNFEHNRKLLSLWSFAVNFRRILHRFFFIILYMQTAQGQGQITADVKISRAFVTSIIFVKFHQDIPNSKEIRGQKPIRTINKCHNSVINYQSKFILILWWNFTEMIKVHVTEAFCHKETVSTGVVCPCSEYLHDHVYNMIYWDDLRKIFYTSSKILFVESSPITMP